jgi:probable HAF family extracellular repeat protein
MCISSRALGIFLLSFLILPAAVAQTYTYRLTEIPVQRAGGNAISNNGFITGLTFERDVDGEAFLWAGNTPGKEEVTFFEPLPDEIFVGSEGTDVNHLGQVTGFIFSETSSLAAVAFFWDGAQKEYFGVFPLGNFGRAHAINASGNVTGIGSIDMDTGENHTFLWDGTSTRDLGTLGGTQSSGNGINASGHVTGDSTNAKGKVRAFLWDGITMRRLFTLGGSVSSGSDVNAMDQVVGLSTNKLGQTRAFLWQDGLMQDLGTLGGPSSAAFAINDAGQVVGASGRRPFLWERGTMRDVNALIAPTDPLKPLVTLNNVQDINNVGQMVGNAGVTSETPRTYLISPVYKMSEFLAPTTSSWRRGSTVRVAFAVLDAKSVRIPDGRATLLIAQPGCRVRVSATGAQTLPSTCMKYNATTNEFWFDWKLAGTGTGTATIESRVNYGSPGPLKVRKTLNISVTS